MWGSVRTSGRVQYISEHNIFYRVHISNIYSLLSFSLYLMFWSFSENRKGIFCTHTHTHTHIWNTRTYQIFFTFYHNKKNKQTKSLNTKCYKTVNLVLAIISKCLMPFGNKLIHCCTPLFPLPDHIFLTWEWKDLCRSKDLN